MNRKPKNKLPKQPFGPIISKAEMGTVLNTRKARLFAKKRDMIRIVVFSATLIIPIAYLSLNRTQLPLAIVEPLPRVTSPQDSTVTALESAIVRAPTPENYLNLSVAYYAAKRYQDCIDAARKSLALKPNQSVAYNNIGVAMNELARWDSAIVPLTEALRIDPNFTLAKNNLNWALSERKRIADEVRKLEQQTANHPSPEKLLNLSQLYFQAGRYRECIGASRKAIQLKPDYALAFNNIAAAYLAVSDWDRAIEAAQQAVRLAPDFQLAKNNLAFAQSQRHGKAK